jgi:tetratricopeptide (TPR) repeat protein
MRSHHLLLGSTLAATLAVTALGSADPPSGKVSVSLGGSAAPAGSAALATRPDGKSKAGASPRDAALARGHGAYMARDYPGAIQAYKEAIAEDGADPTGYYFLGEAQIAGGSAAEADASFAAGLRNAGGKDDLRAKLLFVVADLRERQGKWPEAKKVWEEYAQFLATHPNVKGYAATATERVKVIDARVDLDTKYVPVRQRIEQRQKENAAAAASNEAPAPAPAKKK